MAASLIKRLAWFLLRPVVQRHGPPGHVYLTFDDGPHPQLTPRLLGTLEQAGVHATFFMTGELMAQHPELVQRVRERGHTIGLHGYSHAHVHELSWSEQVDDLRRMASTAASLGLRFRFYRPPYGELSVIRILWCALHGVRIVMWTFDSRDAFAASAQALQDQSTQWAIRGGDVVLFHDDAEATIESMPTLLNQIKRSHFALARL